MKKSVKLACHVVNSNIANGSLPTLQISLRIVSLFKKIYDGEPILTIISNIGEDVNTDVSIQCMMWKIRYCTKTLFAKNRNRVRRAVLGLLQDGACTDLFENLSVNSIKLFSHPSLPLIPFPVYMFKLSASCTAVYSLRLVHTCCLSGCM